MAGSVQTTRQLFVTVYVSVIFLPSKPCNPFNNSAFATSCVGDEAGKYTALICVLYCSKRLALLIWSYCNQSLYPSFAQQGIAVKNNPKKQADSMKRRVLVMSFCPFLRMIV